MKSAPRRLAAVVASFPLLAIAAIPAGAARADTPPSTLTASRIVNVRVQPMALAFGIYGVNLDFTVASRWDVGPSFAWFNSDASGREVVVRQYGLVGSFYPWWTDTGRLFIRPALGYLSVSTFTNRGILNANNYALSALLGYQWLWNQGFNIGFGAGAVYYDVPPGAPSGATMGLPTSELQPELEWSLGWQF